jgi:hypothetical protein
MRRPHTLITAAVVLGAGAFTAGMLTTGGIAADQGAPPAGADPALVAAGLAEAAAGTSVDSCTLLTEAEAAAALGAEVSAVPNPSQCTYVAMDGTARAVSITVPDYAGNKREFAPGAEQAANALEGTFQEITAGDEGYAIVSPMVSEGLARVGDTYVVVVLTNARGTAGAQAAQLDGLLQTAFSRL